MRCEQTVTLFYLAMIWTPFASAQVDVSHKPKSDIANSIGMTFVHMPIRKAESHVETANASNVPKSPYYLGMHEVTQEQYERIVGNNPSFFGKAALADAWDKTLPVERVNWFEATEFCVQLTALSSERGAGHTYRLPTSDEWEYACQAGGTTAYPSGDGPSRLKDFAWFTENSEGRTHKVGEKQPNAWGLFDMHGNVAEWCDTTVRSRLPQGPDLRVVRGGSYRSLAKNCRGAHVSSDETRYRSNYLGFRVVLIPTPAPK